MSDPRHPLLDTRSQPRQAHGATPVAARVQPPLQEVLKGLDARELEGETVFDQLFGPLPAGDPRRPGR